MELPPFFKISPQLCFTCVQMAPPSEGGQERRNARKINYMKELSTWNKRKYGEERFYGFQGDPMLYLRYLRITNKLKHHVRNGLYVPVGKWRKALSCNIFLSPMGITRELVRNAENVVDSAG